MSQRIEGSEHLHRWLIASCTKMLAEASCPYPFFGVFEEKPDRKKHDKFFDLLFIGPTVQEVTKDQFNFTLTVQLVCSVVQTHDSLHWVYLLQGWADQMFGRCFPVKTVPMVVNNQSMQKSGNNTKLGDAKLISPKTVDVLNTQDNMNRTIVSAVYMWEHICTKLTDKL